jgi:hypothetical protein
MMMEEIIQDNEHTTAAADAHAISGQIEFAEETSLSSLSTARSHGSLMKRKKTSK